MKGNFCFPSRVEVVSFAPLVLARSPPRSSNFNRSSFHCSRKVIWTEYSCEYKEADGAKTPLSFLSHRHHFVVVDVVYGPQVDVDVHYGGGLGVW